MSAIKAAIVGGTGYTGVELLRLLAGHPGVEVTAITSRAEAGTPVAELFPSLRGHYDLISNSWRPAMWCSSPLRTASPRRRFRN